MPPRWLEPPLRLLLRGFAGMPGRLRRRLAGAPTEIDGQRLDPEVQLALRLVAATGGDRFEALPVPEARLRVEAEARIFRGRRLPVGAVRDLSVAGAADPLPARLYDHTPAGEPAPLVVYFHGGGWVVGSLDTHDSAARFLSRESGALVLAVDYRLAPEHPFPAAVEDAAAAFRWAVEHAAELGADPRRIAVAGDSAGGNLAAVVALEADGARPAMQALIYPVCDLSRKRRSYQLFGEGFFLSEPQMDWYRDHYLAGPAAASDPRASPLLAADLAGAPPAYIAVAGFDPLRDECVDYAERLREAGVAVELRVHRGLVHGFANAVGAGRVAAQAMGEVAAALRAGLSRPPVPPPVAAYASADGIEARREGSVR